MPANIASTNGVYNAMYVGQRPWHGLGVVVDDAKTPEEAMELAGTNYEVIPAEVAVKIDGEWVETADHVANVRDDTKAILGIVAPGYKRIQNITPMRFLNKIVGTGQAGIVAHFALGKGERLAAVLDLRRLRDIKIPTDESAYEQFIVAQWWHTGTGAFTVTPSMIRVDCQNMADANLLRSEQSGKVVRVLHTGNVEASLEEAQRVLGFAEVSIDNFARLMTAFAETPLPSPTDSWISEFTERLIPIPADMDRPAIRVKARLAIRDLFESSKTLTGVPDSAYRAFQSVTEYADHYRPLRTSQPALVPARRFASSIDGPAASLKANAARLLREEFEITA